VEDRFRGVKIEAANRAEATALLIRCGYEVYRPEFDAEGVDLVVRAPSGELRSVQLKGNAAVDRNRYSRGKIWMLFPCRKYSASNPRNWYLVRHKNLYAWLWKLHEKAKMRETGKWGIPNGANEPKALSRFLKKWRLRTPN
jgi:hypothetical protein